jgi:hypothetical protein
MVQSTKRINKLEFKIRRAQAVFAVTATNKKYRKER